MYFKTLVLTSTALIALMGCGGNGSKPKTAKVNYLSTNEIALKFGAVKSNIKSTNKQEVSHYSYYADCIKSSCGILK